MANKRVWFQSTPLLASLAGGLFHTRKHCKTFFCKVHRWLNQHLGVNQHFGESGFHLFPFFCIKIKQKLAKQEKMSKKEYFDQQALVCRSRYTTTGYGCQKNGGRCKLLPVLEKMTGKFRDNTTPIKLTNFKVPVPDVSSSLCHPPWLSPSVVEQLFQLPKDYPKNKESILILLFQVVFCLF